MRLTQFTIPRITQPGALLVRYAGLLLVALLLSSPVSAADAPDADDFAQLLAQLSSGSFSEKEQIISGLAALDDPRVLNTLKYLQQGDLYTRKAVSYTHLTLPTNREV